MSGTSRLPKIFLFTQSLIITLTLSLLTGFISHSYAGGYIDGTSAQNYLDAPAVGSSVTGYLSGEYLNDGTSSFKMFIGRCECLKRLNYVAEGILVTDTQIMTEEEFDQLGPDTIWGMIDTNGTLSNALAGEPGLIAVIERVYDFNRTGTHFAAVVKIKFVSETP